MGRLGYRVVASRPRGAGVVCGLSFLRICSPNTPVLRVCPDARHRMGHPRFPAKVSSRDAFVVNAPWTALGTPAMSIPMPVYGGLPLAFCTALRLARAIEFGCPR